MVKASVQPADFISSSSGMLFIIGTRLTAFVQLRNNAIPNVIINTVMTHKLKKIKKRAKFFMLPVTLR
jgi:hypothetical protein